jgi:hypothetical protein
MAATVLGIGVDKRSIACCIEPLFCVRYEVGMVGGGALAGMGFSGECFRGSSGFSTSLT